MRGAHSESTHGTRPRVPLCDDLAALAARVAADSEQQQGECVLLIGGDTRDEAATLAADQRRVLDILAAELPLKQAVALTARITGGNRNALYQAALAARDEG